MDTLGDLLTLLVTPANEQDRDQIQQFAQQVREVTGETVEAAFVNEGYTGQKAAQAAPGEGVRLEVVQTYQR